MKKRKTKGIVLTILLIIFMLGVVKLSLSSTIQFTYNDCYTARVGTVSREFCWTCSEGITITQCNQLQDNAKNDKNNWITQETDRQEEEERRKQEEQARKINDLLNDVKDIANDAVKICNRDNTFDYGTNNWDNYEENIKTQVENKKQTASNTILPMQIKFTRDNYQTYYNYIDRINNAFDDRKERNKIIEEEYKIEQLKKKDTDLDGVKDFYDLCAETPVFEAIDKDGCSCSQKDDDNDNVDNCLDKCKNISETVNSYSDIKARRNDTDGCVDDYDKDGIIDVFDSCPEKEESFDSLSDMIYEFNDFDGCPDDLDDDGIADEEDEKPNQLFPITMSYAFQYGGKVYGDYIVWHDNRFGDYDIFMLNLETGNETQITNNTNDQINPDIYDNIIIWQDKRNVNDDIYIYNIDTGVEKAITIDKYTNVYPMIHENKIVWQRADFTTLEEPHFDVMLFILDESELDTGSDTETESNANTESNNENTNENENQ